MTDVACPTCGHSFVVHDAHLNAIVDCPNCKLSLRIQDNITPERSPEASPRQRRFQHPTALSVRQTQSHAKSQPPRALDPALAVGGVVAIVLFGVVVYGVSQRSIRPTSTSPSGTYDSYSSPDSSVFPERRAGVTRDDVRQTLREMESNVPQTLKEMEDDLPDIMADLEREMMRDAHKFGLSPSDVRAQVRDIETGAREQIRGIEGDVRKEIRGMEDDVWQELQRVERGY